MRKIKILVSFFFIPLTVHCVEWRNWAGNVRCDPQRVVKPSTVDELQELVLKANRENKRLRAIGTGHSWTDILCNDGYLVNTDALNSVLEIDKTKKQIRVQAGIKLKDLVTVLAKHNLALPNQPAILEQSIAGVISTATHGTGHTGTMADFITEIELLAADGNRYTISKKQHAEWFAAARVSVGSLGIVYALTIQCEPLFYLERQRYTADLETVLKDYPVLNKQNDFFTFYSRLGSDMVKVELLNRVVHKTEAQLPFNWLWAQVNWLFKKACSYLAICKVWARYADYSSNEPSYEALSGKPGLYYLEEEIAVKQTDLPQAIKAVRALAQDYQRKGQSIDAHMTIRFVKAEKYSLLSPAANQDVAFVSITTLVNSDYSSFYHNMFNALLTLGGRPHWGKLNYLTKKDALSLYGNNYDQFVAVRKQLDPHGMFSNEFTERIFGW